jgi:hypothetical protein
MTNDTAQDSPFSALAVGQGEFSRSFSATMYLEWVPIADGSCTAGSICTVPVPLGSVNWQWQGSATDTLRPETDTNGVAYKLWLHNSCGDTQNNGGFQPGGVLPQWSSTDNPI